MTIGRPIEESNKSHWFLRGLGLQFASFVDTRMMITRDLSHQAKQFEIMLKSMEGRASSQAVFMADRGNPNTGTMNRN